MSVLEAILLGIVQGLTEFLPVSSSGHIELGKALLGVEIEDNLTFSVLVHGATVLSILVIYGREIMAIILKVLEFKWNDETKFAAMIALSMIPVGVVGILFEDKIEALFSGRLVLVGTMLLVTAALLLVTHWAPKKGKDIGFLSAGIIGIAQAIAILPGISRSGATIATALLLGIDRDKATRFSFLMVIVPILGATLLKGKDLAEAGGGSEATMPMLAGFIAAFLSGLLACKLMITLVRRGGIAWFSVYCAIAGLAAIFTYI